MNKLVADKATERRVSNTVHKLSEWISDLKGGEPGVSGVTLQTGRIETVTLLQSASIYIIHVHMTLFA